MKVEEKDSEKQKRSKMRQCDERKGEILRVNAGKPSRCFVV